MREHANNCHLQLLIAKEEKAEVREMHAALSISVTTVQNTVVLVMVLYYVNFNHLFEKAK